MLNREFGLDDIVGFLSTLDLFQSLDLALLLKIREAVELVHLKGGSFLFRQGDKGEDLFFVVSGRLRYMRERDGKEEIIAEITRGETVGETAILTSEPYFASVQAIRDSYLLRLSGINFMHLLEQDPRTMTQIARTLISRMRKAMETIPQSNPLSTIAIFSLLEKEKEKSFLDSFFKALQNYGSALFLNSEYIEKALSREYVIAPRNSQEGIILVRWLNFQEAEYDFIVFQLDPSQEEWTRRSLRQADLVLIVAEASANPEISEVEKKYLSFPDQPVRAARHLALLHPSKESIPQNTYLWLENRTLDLHHHLMDGDEKDLHRLARILTGKGVSLVLGGGGARGLAHIGIVRALREKGIPIDMVGGTSMGAILGAQVAAGWNDEKMFENTKEYMDDGKGILDYTLPMVSFLAGQRLSLSMEKLAEGRNIEDLWLPYFCISSNLNTGHVDTHKRGLLWKAVRASSSLPAIFPPVRLGEEWHVDGGVLNNLPVDIMRHLNPQGKILAVDVSSDDQFTYHDQQEPALSGWYVLWRKLNPFAPPMNVPNIVDILMRSIELHALSSKSKTVEQSRVDLYIRPPTQKFGMLEFKSMEAIVEAGYQYALEHLDEWKKKLGLS